MTTDSTEVLLFVFQNGLNGDAGNFSNVENAIRAQLSKYNTPSKHVLYIRSECNQEKDTLHGLEMMGKRLAKEIIEKTSAFAKTYRALDKREEGEESEEGTAEKVHFRGTFIGHSLGGLILRNAFRWLFRDRQTANELSDLGICIQPHSYMTLVSPHLGSRRPVGTRAWKLMENIKYLGASIACNRMLGKTGLELYLEDPEQILLEMSRGEYLEALKMFQHRTAVATSFGDLMVPHSSASIRSHNPHKQPQASWKPSFKVLAYSGFEAMGHQHHAVVFEENGARIESDPGVVFANKYTETSLSSPSKVHKRPLCVDNWNEVEFYSEMLENLNSIPWRRIDLEFDLPIISRSVTHILPIALRRQMPVLHKDKIYEEAKRWLNILASVVSLDIFDAMPMGNVELGHEETSIQVPEKEGVSCVVSVNGDAAQDEMLLQRGESMTQCTKTAMQHQSETTVITETHITTVGSV